MASATVNPNVKQRCFKVLRRVAPVYNVLPKSYSPLGVTLSNDMPRASGVFSDIWEGQLDGNRVCVKTFRTRTEVDLKKIKQVRHSF